MVPINGTGTSSRHRDGLGGAGSASLVEQIRRSGNQGGDRPDADRQRMAAKESHLSLVCRAYPGGMSCRRLPRRQRRKLYALALRDGARSLSTAHLDRPSSRRGSRLTKEALQARFPYMFEGPHIGLDFHEGWMPILAAACEKVEAALGPDKAGFHFTQIKEKYGSARFYSIPTAASS